IRQAPPGWLELGVELDGLFRYRPTGVWQQKAAAWPVEDKPPPAAPAGHCRSASVAAAQDPRCSSVRGSSSESALLKIADQGPPRLAAIPRIRTDFASANFCCARSALQSPSYEGKCASPAPIACPNAAAAGS